MVVRAVVKCSHNGMLISTRFDPSPMSGHSTPKHPSFRSLRLFSESPRLELLPASPRVTGENHNIKVVCRIRPLTKYESSRLIVETFNDDGLAIHGKDYSSTFTFDRVFGPSSLQHQIYDYSIKQTLESFLDGYNGTVLTYGQTGSGKSYTMFGPSPKGDHRGVVPRIIEDIFSHIADSSSNVQYTVGVSYMEIYMEQLRDLLDPLEKAFTIHEDKESGVFVKGMSQMFVSSAEEMELLLQLGSSNRQVASTQMNFESSRSHAIFQIKLSQKDTLLGSTKTSTLFLVDLAGSEKVTKTGAVGQNLQEAKKINSSLSVLGLVIKSLTDGTSTHVPYRDSKLTRILQESLGGNSRTTLIINCAPSEDHEIETLSTLRFGSRAKRIKNVVHINTELGMSQLKLRIAHLEQQNDKHVEHIQTLEHELTELRARTVHSPKTPSRLPMVEERSVLAQMSDEISRRDQKIAELEAEVLSIKMDSLKTAHTEELKLFRLENALHKLGDKLNDVELINANLRKHLLISEKMIESRDAKIEKLKASLSSQQAQVLSESSNFESKLEAIKEKINFVDNGQPKEFTQAPLQTFIKEQVLSVNNNIQNSGDATSPRLPKVMLNLRIVKPLRGGQTN